MVMVVANKPKGNGAFVGGNKMTILKTILVVVGLVSLLFVLVRTTGTPPDASSVKENSGHIASPSLSHGAASSNAIVEGTFQEINYYHCGATTTQQGGIVDIVLLHGSRFTKEDWKSSTILSRLCQHNQVRVTALDLEVSAKYPKLVALLEGMAQPENGLMQLPVAALMTPSASGLSVVSAIQQGQATQMSRVTRLWVPIASYSAMMLSAEQLAVLPNTLPIWSIHGDQDNKGKHLSAKLKAEAGAQVTEFPGGHPFYLSIPEEFSNALLKKLGVKI